MMLDRNMPRGIQVDLDVISINNTLSRFYDLQVVLLEDIVVVKIVRLNYGMMIMIIHILSCISILFNFSLD